MLTEITTNIKKMKPILSSAFGAIIFSLVLGFSTGTNAKESTQKDFKKNQKEYQELQILFQKGIDFTANGNNPDWTLEIDFDKVFHFSATDGLVLNTPPVTGTKAMDANVTFYHATTESGEIRITVSGEKCTDSISGEVTNYLTRIEAKYSSENEFRSYSGCGKFIFDYRLRDIWVLKEMNGVILNSENLTKGLPVFEFNPGSNRFTGHAGCNDLNAGIDVRGDKITFGKVISTRKACPDMSLEQKVLSVIDGKTFSYKIDEGTLTLQNDSNIILTFKKTD
jgi:heat shock protein HslJ/uncharacterized membrane protein